MTSEIIAYLHLRFVVDLDTGTLVRRIDTYKGGFFNPAGTIAGTPNTKGYLCLFVKRKCYCVHRLIWLVAHNNWPSGQLDHIDRNKQNNSICNLREVTQSQNLQNRFKNSNNKSGYKGVYWNKNCCKWQVSITIDKNRIHVGYFNNIKNAITARSKAEKQYFTHAPENC